jgi:hypothetical protein
MPYFNQRVDSEGVPCIVQDMQYNHAWFWIEVTYFNGIEITIEPPRSHHLLDKELSVMAWLEAERDAEALFLKHGGEFNAIQV